MTPILSRRRFLAVSAVAVALPAAAATPGAHAIWQGIALGAPASMRLEGVTQDQARAIFAEVEAELSRLEDIFSLYRPDSALARLNRDGVLTTPPAELLEVLSLSASLNQATDGAFDPTVQPLWQALAEAQTNGPGLDAETLDATRARTGWAHLRFDRDAVRFMRPGMALTLNGIAQGYITDRISTLLAARGYADTVIDMGEVRARGVKTGGTPWTAGIATPDGTIVRRITLADRALATSAPLGTVLDPAGQIGHIIDPRTGGSVEGRTLISVSARTAALADGLSTACCLLEPELIKVVIGGFPDTILETLI